MGAQQPLAVGGSTGDSELWMELRNMMEGEGIKLKLRGLPGVLSPFHLRSLCSLAPKPRQTLRVLAGAHGPFLMFSWETVDRKSKTCSIWVRTELFLVNLIFSTL